jgi:hypothetical protein
MTLQLWGQAKDNQEDIYNLLKYLHVKTGAIIVGIAHEKEVKDDDNPEFNTLIPSLMTSAATSLCAKASYVWYTNIEKEQILDADNNVISKQYSCRTSSKYNRSKYNSCNNMHTNTKHIIFIYW